MLEENPRQWHEKLSETLWAYRISKREATGMTPYALTYGHDAILPMEIAVQSIRIAQQHNLVGEDYSQAMLLELEGMDASRIDTLNKLLAGKQIVARAYNKREWIRCDGFALSPTTFKRQRRGPIILDGFAHALPRLPIPTSFDVVKSTSLMTLPLLPYRPPPPSSVSVVTNRAMVPVEFELIKPCEGEEKLMDLNTAATIPEEKDLLQQLQGSAPTPTPINVIGSEEVECIMCLTKCCSEMYAFCQFIDLLKINLFSPHEGKN
ncbi:hypothetical protein L3X38_042340 [Prunus dulcis]|uniref:Uncharacterized protein n=1 Tax=Prunus dulcis TaxID=3755 RepID=A0AAD4UW40_PRUDU|nr:hypothetical protein L3X38_042340 [Prunus dulcis]